MIDDVVNRKKVLLRAFVQSGDCDVLFDARHPGYQGIGKGEESVRVSVDSYVEVEDFVKIGEGEEYILAPIECILAFNLVGLGEWYVFEKTVRGANNVKESSAWN